MPLGALVMLSRCFLDCSVAVGVFVTGLSQIPSFFSEPELILNGEKIKVVKEARFLGAIFDEKLSFIPHFKALNNKCLKALDIIKVVANQEWGGGADESVLLNLYRSLIRSRLDYGCVVYGSARPSYLKNVKHYTSTGFTSGSRCI